MPASPHHIPFISLPAQARELTLAAATAPGYYGDGVQIVAVVVEYGYVDIVILDEEVTDGGQGPERRPRKVPIARGTHAGICQAIFVAEQEASTASAA